MPGRNKGLRWKRIGSITHLAVSARSFWNQWVKWLDGERDDSGDWPKDATGELGVAVLGRFLRIGLFAAILAGVPVSLIGVQTYVVYNQTRVLERQNQEIALQNVFSSFEQTSNFRALLAAVAPGEEPFDVIAEGRSWLPANPAVVRQLAQLGRERERFLNLGETNPVVSALRPLLRDRNVTVASGALQALYELGERKFQQVQLKGADLGGANLKDADLSGANLAAASLLSADMRGVNLSKAELTRTILDQTQLQGADLRDAKMIESNLAGANLGKADLRGAFLSGANLFKSDLSGADMKGARLDVSHLFIVSSTDHASPVGADTMTAVDLRESNITLNQLESTLFYWTARLPEKILIDLGQGTD